MTFSVRGLTPQSVISIVKDYVEGRSVTGECIDEYTVQGEGNVCVATCTVEKHFVRAGNRLTLTVVADNFDGTTRVHSISGGGGEGLFSFDWGASSSFENSAQKALKDYII